MSAYIVEQGVYVNCKRKHLTQRNIFSQISGVYTFCKHLINQALFECSCHVFQ